MSLNQFLSFIRIYFARNNTCFAPSFIPNNTFKNGFEKIWLAFLFIL